MVNARLGDWTEAYESQSIFLLLTLIDRQDLYSFPTLLRLGFLS